MATPSATASVRIVGFDPRWRGDFARLNLEWLRRWFVVEPFDEEVLGDPETHLLAGGGHVLFALDGAGDATRAVGTVALRHDGEGWGALAQRLGIKPGSEEFHELKRGFVPTYDHWARPLPLDDGLRRAFPDRGRASTEAVIREHRQEQRGNGNAGPKVDNGNRGRGNAGKAKGGNARGNSGKGDKAKGNSRKGNSGKGNGKSNNGKG